MPKNINILNINEKQVALELCLKMLKVNELLSESWVGSYYGGPSLFENEIANLRQDCRRLLGEINYGAKDHAISEYNKMVERYSLWDETHAELMSITT